MVEIMEYIKTVKTKDIQDLVQRSKVKDYPLILVLLLDMLAYTNREFISECRLFSACVDKFSVTSDSSAKSSLFFATCFCFLFPFPRVLHVCEEKHLLINYSVYCLLSLETYFRTAWKSICENVTDIKNILCVKTVNILWTHKKQFTLWAGYR